MALTAEQRPQQERKPLLRVTSILGNLGWKTPGLVAWANREGRAGHTLEEARQTPLGAGTLTHRRIEAAIKRKPQPPVGDLSPEITERSDLAFAAFEDWKRSSSFELVASEVYLEHPSLGYCGVIDCVAAVNGEIAIVDWKNAKAVYGDNIVQVAAYQELWNVTSDKEATSCHVLRLPPEGGFSHHKIGEAALDAGWQVFEHLIAIQQLKARVKA
jgi:hypothetical protein